MESWKKIKFEKDLLEWWERTLEKQPELDSDYKKIFPAIINKAKTFDSIADKLLAKDLEYLHSEEGCVFMSKVALRAAQLANAIASLTGLTNWKQGQEELKKKRAKKQQLLLERLAELRSELNEQGTSEECVLEDYYASDDSDEEIVYTGFVRQINPSFIIGKDSLMQSMLRDLDTWESKIWIQESFANVLKAKTTTHARYMIYGNPSYIGKRLRLDVDAFVIPRTKTEEGNYYFNVAKGEDEDRVISTTEAVMNGHWKMASMELERLVEKEIPTFTEFYQYFEIDEEDST